MRENQTFTTHSEAQTITCAQQFPPQVQGGDIILLYGDLGMGKSVFSRALIRALCGDNKLEVPSPTFTLVQQYDCKIAPIWHFDLYRLSDESEVYEIGWDEALNGGISLIEWPERLGRLAPQSHIEISLSKIVEEQGGRHIEVTYHE